MFILLTYTPKFSKSSLTISHQKKTEHNNSTKTTQQHVPPFFPHHFPLIFHLQAATWTYPHHQRNPSAPRHGDLGGSDRGYFVEGLWKNSKAICLGVLEPKWTSKVRLTLWDMLKMENKNDNKKKQSVPCGVFVDFWCFFGLCCKYVLGLTDEIIGYEIPLATSWRRCCFTKLNLWSSHCSRIKSSQE